MGSGLASLVDGDTILGRKRIEVRNEEIEGPRYDTLDGVARRIARWHEQRRGPRGGAVDHDALGLVNRRVTPPSILSRS